VTREEILSIKDTIGYWANNCGGCETCEREFRGKEEPTFDMQTVYEIISVYEDLLKEKENVHN
jgi:Ni,Fe-hydrogenase III small subunit